MSETDTTTDTAPRWWVDEYTAVPDPIEADTDYCFDTAAEAAEHGSPGPSSSTPPPTPPGPSTPATTSPPATTTTPAYYLATREPVRDEDRGTWYRFS